MAVFRIIIWAIKWFGHDVIHSYSSMHLIFLLYVTVKASFMAKDEIFEILSSQQNPSLEVMQVIKSTSSI